MLKSILCHIAVVDLWSCKRKMFYSRSKHMNPEPSFKIQSPYAGIQEAMYPAFHLYQFMFPKNIPQWGLLEIPWGRGGSQKPQCFTEFWTKNGIFRLIGEGVQTKNPRGYGYFQNNKFLSEAPPQTCTFTPFLFPTSVVGLETIVSVVLSQSC